MRLIKEIILHCSATWSKQDIGAKEIRQWHVKGNGWRDIGYHYVIRRNGLIEPGRDLNEVGAHCTNHNANSIGICMVGGGPNGEDKDFTDEQFKSLSLLVKFLRQRFPKATIYGHKEFANKACPVFDVQEFLDRFDIPKEGKDE